MLISYYYRFDINNSGQIYTVKPLYIIFLYYPYEKDLILFLPIIRLFYMVFNGIIYQQFNTILSIFLYIYYINLFIPLLWSYKRTEMSKLWNGTFYDKYLYQIHTIQEGTEKVNIIFKI